LISQPPKKKKAGPSIKKQDVKIHQVITKVAKVAGSFPIYAKNSVDQIMTEEERQDYNERSYQKYKAAGSANARNECEICGFVPYTKNKYREKQDHLAKFHFKERIDQVLPTSRPYVCPDIKCDYLGKDKQDILRHYTGKHNILKMWVDTFIREQTGQKPEKARRPLWQTGQIVKNQNNMNDTDEDAVTFKEMEGMAIQNEKTDIETDRTDLPQPHANEDIHNQQTPNSGITIRKISKSFSVTSSQSAPSFDAQPNISLMRVSKPNQDIKNNEDQNQNKTHHFVTKSKSSITNNKQAPGNTKLPKLVLVKCKFCVNGESLTFPSIPLWKEHCMIAHSDLDLSSFEDNRTSSEFREEKQKCFHCNMNFPTIQALKLHKEVCPEVFDSDEGHLSDDSNSNNEDLSLEPPKKKAKRPPPPLIKIM